MQIILLLRQLNAVRQQIVRAAFVTEFAERSAEIVQNAVDIPAGSW